MKQLFYITTFCTLLILAGCSKSNIEKNPLVGKWLWEKSAGGATGNDIKTPLPGTFKMLCILTESEYFIDFGQDNYVKMRYTIAPATDITTGQAVQGIIFYDGLNNPGTPQHYVIQGSQLIITDNITESYRHYYKRVAED